MTQEQDTVDPRNARTQGYREDLEEINSKGVCPFCPGPLYLAWHKKPILRENDSWLFTENSHPYPNTESHHILIMKRHIEHISELSPKDLEFFIEMIGWATVEFKISGGGFTMRFGDTLHTGATVKHLHAHLIVPKVKDGKTIPVYFPIG